MIIRDVENVEDTTRGAEEQQSVSLDSNESKRETNIRPFAELLTRIISQNVELYFCELNNGHFKSEVMTQ